MKTLIKSSQIPLYQQVVEWIRESIYSGELVEDDRREARQSMLDAYPSLQKMYSADDGNTEVFYFKNATATFSSFTQEPKVVKF